MMPLPLWASLAIAGAGMAVMYPWGRYVGRRALRWQYEAGYNAGKDDRNAAIESRMRDGWRLVPHPVTMLPRWLRPGEHDRPPDRMMTLPGASHLPSMADYRAGLEAIGASDDEAVLLTLPGGYRPAEQGPPLYVATLEASSGPGRLPRADETCPRHPGYWLPCAACYVPPAELEANDFDDSVSYAAAPAELTPLGELEGPGGLGELEREITAYLSNRANGDIWRLEQDAEHRRWCLSNGLPWQPIDW